MGPILGGSNMQQMLLVISRGFPFFCVFFWAGNTDDPCSMMSANDMCNVLSYVVSHGQEQNFRMQKVISDILYLKSPTQIYLYQLIL